ncbi:VWA domain-containing protein [Proteus mirabilis]|uniref:vWA domain-containing protein n=1 Tax=Proteus vulgaris TaxID=585 RepID=UPI000B41266F|nr:VWA domain-containing protein [Proteus mirabilis]
MESSMKKFIVLIAAFILPSMVFAETAEIANLKAPPAQTDIIFVLDKSGSMQGYEKDTIGGFNTILAENKNRPEKVYITTILFDSKAKKLHNRIDINKIEDLTTNDYFASGNTALLDAVGNAITEENKPNSPYKNVMMVIITDGEENSSREYSLEKVKSLITSAEKEKGWEFIFLGANFDAISAAESIGIKSSNSTQYIQDAKGYGNAYESVNKAVQSKIEGKELNEDWKSSVEQDYKERK